MRDATTSDPHPRRRCVTAVRGVALCLALCVASACMAAAAPPSLRAAVDALEQDSVADADFGRLLARIDAEGAPTLKARAYVLRCQRGVGEDPAAMRPVAEAGVALARRIGAGAELGGLLLCRGYIEERAGRLARALADYGEAIAVCRRAGAAGDAAQAQVLRGELQHQVGRYAEALADMQAAYRHYVAVGNVRQQHYTLNAIANFYADPKVAQYDRALAEYRRLLAAHRARGEAAESATARYNIASTLDRLGREAEALAEFRAVLAGYAAQGRSADVADTRRAIASLQLRAGRAAEALVEADRARTAAAGVDDADLRARIALVRANALRALGRGEEALADLDAAEAVFRGEDNARYLEEVENARAGALSALGRWQEAYAARDRQLALAKRLERQLEQDLTARMRVRFDTERTERENAALQRENALRSRALADAQRIRRLQATILALGGAVLAGVLALAWRLLRRARRLRTLAMTDELTAGPNRRAILGTLARRLAARDRTPVPVLMFDIDRFKSINDARGHEAGDAVLVAVAATARQALGAEGALGRIGGEEFLAVLRGGDEAAARAVGERLRAAVAALRIAADDAPFGVTISLGGTLARPGVDRAEDALKRADLALYRAKDAGRDRLDWQPATIA